MDMIDQKQRKAIVISASSDIGFELCKWWHGRSWDIVGTFRTGSTKTSQLGDLGVGLVQCELENNGDINDLCKKWDVLVFCPGMLDPIGSFLECDYDYWNSSINVNFINQLRILHRLLPNRNTSNGLEPRVIFFAGGGTNSAPINYSAYTISKIALIKMCELLDAEIQDTGFSIIGPGWVKTKIHKTTLEAGKKAGKAYALTKNRLQSNHFTSMKLILECCDWIVHSHRRVVSGRNFSVVHDMWGEKTLEEMLISNKDMYKLRRYGNRDAVKIEEN